MFTPINHHIEVDPIKQDNFIADPSATYEEKGNVISIADNVQLVHVGDIVYFDSWTVAKYPDESGKIRYLVQEENVRAIERNA